MKNKYNRTVTACFVGYIVQAIVNNFVPLLFLTFQRSYQISLSQVTLLVTFNFGIQLLVDLLSVKFVDRIGYRTAMVTAHIMAAAGLILLTVLPDIMTSPFAGILTAVMVYAIGGGLLEVIVSPVVEACPSDNKEKAMSMLHSFYCWGHAGVVLFSTVFFYLAGIENWKILAIVWAVIPVINALVFTKVPIAPLMEEGETGFKLRELFSIKIFWVLLVMMICAGASEQAVSQWVSTFAEKRSGYYKDCRRPCGNTCLCASYGIIQTVLRKIWRQDEAGSLYDLQQLSLYSFIFGNCFFQKSASQSDGMRSLRSVCRNYVAGNLQQGVGCTSQRRHCHVCAACPWRRYWLFRRSYCSWNGIGCAGR